MKTKTLSLILLLAVIPFVSCQKDDSEENENFVAVDDVSSFIGHFVSLDENGQVALYLSGYLLNEADPTEISYCTETWEEALKITKGWMSENSKYQETENTLTWEMRDADGTSQGNLVLTRKNDGGLVAEAVVPSSISYVRTIRFIPRASWPQNATELDTDELLDEYFYGNVVNVTEAPAGYDHGTGQFIVIREFDELKNEKGIMFRIPDKPYQYSDNRITTAYRKLEDVKKRSRVLSEVEVVDKLFRADKDFFYKLARTTDFPNELYDGFLNILKYSYDGSVDIYVPRRYSSDLTDGYRFVFPRGIAKDLKFESKLGLYLYELDIYYFWVELNGSKTVLKIQ